MKVITFSKNEDIENSNMNKYYTPPKSKEIQESLKKARELNAKILNSKPLKPEIWEVVQQKLKIDWTYHSNALEGSSLTYGETIFFLQHGLTVEGKPFKDFLDTRNHAEAIDFLMQVIKDERPISEGLIKEINALLLLGVTYTPAINERGEKVRKPATPGQYKKLPNHVLQLDGTIHYYVEPIHVQSEMEYLCQWINENLDKLPPIVVSAIAHYNFVRIHPFDDGNGRGARILMNLILMKKYFPPAIVLNEKRRIYLECLQAADSGDINLFTQFVVEALLKTQESILKEIAKTE